MVQTRSSRPFSGKDGKSRVAAAVNFTGESNTTYANGILMSEGLFLTDGIMLMD